MIVKFPIQPAVKAAALMAKEAKLKVDQTFTFTVVAEFSEGVESVVYTEALTRKALRDRTAYYTVAADPAPWRKYGKPISIRVEIKPRQGATSSRQYLFGRAA